MLLKLFLLENSQMSKIASVYDIESLSLQIDPSILGGLVIEFGQKVFDMSIRTRARQMERLLREPINF